MNRSILFVISAYFIFTFSFSFSSVALALDQGVQSAPAMGEGTSAYVYGLTSARARSLIGVGLGLASLIIGWRTKARAKGSDDRRSWSIAALALGSLAIILSVVHLASNTGGFGTGGGKAGAIVAIVLAVAGAVLGGLGLRRRLEQG